MPRRELAFEARALLASTRDLWPSMMVSLVESAAWCIFPAARPSASVQADRGRSNPVKGKGDRQREREGERARTSKHGIAMIECTPEDICTVFLGSITPPGASILEGGGSKS